MTNRPPIPSRMTSLQRSGELPIPFTVLMVDGKPDFRVTDTERVLACYRRRLCGICGRPLDFWACFVGGPLAIANRMFNDPAMHDECARYALSVCPFLAFRTNGYSSREIPDAAERNSSVSDSRPDIFGLFETSKYELVQHEGAIFARPVTRRKITWFNHDGVFGIGPTPPIWRDVVLLAGGQDFHGVGHACGFCDKQGISYRIKIVAAERVCYAESGIIEPASMDEAHLVRISGASEADAMVRAQAYCVANGWRIRE